MNMLCEAFGHDPRHRIVMGLRRIVCSRCGLFLEHPSMDSVDRMAGGPHRNVIEAYVQRQADGIDSEWAELNT